MKHAGYRSFGNYLSRAKREHINTGGTWHQLLERVGADCVKSVTRGLGPGRQSAPYHLEQVAALRLNEHPLVAQGPVNPRALAVLGAWFLTREIELSLALCKNITVVTNGGVLAVKWCLPASKTDPMAAAVVRELGCMCQGCSAALCPAHVAEEHFRTLTKLFGPNLPKGAVVRTFECLGEKCGKQMLDDLGRRAFGGHSARVNGARFYAGLRIELRRLAVFARWRSDIVLHYVQESALSRFTAECVDLLRKDTSEQICSDDHTERVQIRSRIVKIEQAIEQAAVQEQRLTNRIEQLTALGCPMYVRNETSGTWHKTAAADLRLRPADWSTFCGWRFSSGNFQLVEDFPSTSLVVQRCTKCFPVV